MNSEFKQTKEWEQLLQKCVNKARKCPAIALCSNRLITAEKIEDSAGNHVFDDYFEFWEITQNEGHQIRAVFQKYSVRRNPEFKEYIQDLIDDSYSYERKSSGI